MLHTKFSPYSNHGWITGVRHTVHSPYAAAAHQRHRDHQAATLADAHMPHRKN